MPRSCIWLEGNYSEDINEYKAIARKIRNDKRSCIWVEGNYSEEIDKYVQDGEKMLLGMVNSVERIKHYN